MSVGHRSFLVAGALLVVLLAGVLAHQRLRSSDSSSSRDAASESDPTPAPSPTEIERTDATREDDDSLSVEPASAPAPIATTQPTPTPEPTPSPPADPEPLPPEPTPASPIVVVESQQVPPTLLQAMRSAELLAGSIVMPSDCGLPFDVPASMPNSERAYRSGIHQGIDFICLERGRNAVAAMDGRVVMAVGDYVDPEPPERVAVLDTAGAIGRTPPWTLAMMYGNFVVIDHGPVADVGHVVSVYAHFERLAEQIRPGLFVTAGTVLGEIGNKGTQAAGTGADNPRSIHLHWELHIDDMHLGIGLDTAATRETYAKLFSGGAP